MLVPSDVISLSRAEAAHFIRKEIGVEYDEALEAVADEVAEVAAAEVAEESGAAVGGELPDHVKIVHVGGGWHKILVRGKIWGKMKRTHAEAYEAALVAAEENP